MSQNSDFLLEVTVAATGRSVLTLQVSWEWIFFFTSFPFQLRFFVRSFIIWERYRSTIFIRLQVYHCQLTNLLRLSCYDFDCHNLTMAMMELAHKFWLAFLSWRLVFIGWRTGFQNIFHGKRTQRSGSFSLGNDFRNTPKKYFFWEFKIHDLYLIFQSSEDEIWRISE